MRREKCTGGNVQWSATTTTTKEQQQQQE